MRQQAKAANILGSPTAPNTNTDVRRDCMQIEEICELLAEMHEDR